MTGNQEYASPYGQQVIEQPGDLKREALAKDVEKGLLKSIKKIRLGLYVKKINNVEIVKAEDPKLFTWGEFTSHAGNQLNFKI